MCENFLMQNAKTCFWLVWFATYRKYEGWRSHNPLWLKVVENVETAFLNKFPITIMQGPLWPRSQSEDNCVYQTHIQKYC